MSTPQTHLTEPTLSETLIEAARSSSTLPNADPRTSRRFEITKAGRVSGLSLFAGQLPAPHELYATVLNFPGKK